VVKDSAVNSCSIKASRGDDEEEEEVEFGEEPLEMDLQNNKKEGSNKHVVNPEKDKKMPTVVIPRDEEKLEFGGLKAFSLKKTITKRGLKKDLFGPISNQMFFSVKKQDIREDFEVGRKIGEGSFGEVMLVTHKKSGMKRAMKILAKDSIEDHDKNTLLKEVAILKMLDHPNIIKIYDMYEDDRFYYLITEYS